MFSETRLNLDDARQYNRISVTNSCSSSGSSSSSDDGETAVSSISHCLPIKTGKPPSIPSTPFSHYKPSPRKLHGEKQLHGEKYS